MAFTSFTDTGKVCIDFTLNGVGVSICLHFKKPSASAADYQALADAAADNMSTLMTTGITSDLTANLVTVYDLSSETAPVYTSTNTLPITGGGLADSVPNNACYLITTRTNTRGRSGRGRNYMPGLSETQVVDSLITGSIAAARLSEYEAYITAIETAATGWEHVVAQRFSGGVQLTTGLTHNVTSYTVTTVVRSQRRRTRTA